MSIQPLDMNILWGKANARCALCPNKEKVIAKRPENKGRTDLLFGEMCHIIGEKETAARGKSSMPVEDRNRYHNLILLCANHHTIIDKDAVTYTIERLHQIKTDHELWIDSRLDETSVDQADKLYTKLVNAIADDLQLHRLDSVSNGAINGRLPVWFVDGVNQLLVMMFKTNWPGKRSEIEVLLRDFELHLRTYMQVFHSNAEIDAAGEFYRRIKRYKDAPEDSPERGNLVIDYNSWQRQSHNALWNLVVALNNLAMAVRKDLKPSFFFMEGKFAINDELGTTNGGEPIMYIPANYQSLDAE